MSAKHTTDWNILQVHDGTRYASDGAALSVALRIARKGIETRCPMVTVQRRIGIRRRMTKLRVPMLPGYLFVEGTAEARRVIAEGIKGATGWMVRSEAPVAVPDDVVRRLMAAHDDITQRPVETVFRIGDDVIAERGPMEGWALRVVAVADAELLVASPLFGGAVTARIHPNAVRVA